MKIINHDALFKLIHQMYQEIPLLKELLSFKTKSTM